MIDLLSTSQVLLREAGFSVRLTSVGKTSVVCFEDEALIGFCSSFGEPQDLLDGWKPFEGEMLNRFAPQIRTAGDKAWNVYCVFLCSTSGNSLQNRAVAWIEEDLERTRKIAACAVGSREDLIRALLPVLPIQYQPALEHEDLTERLQRRIADIAPAAARIALDPSVAPAEVVRVLGERS